MRKLFLFLALLIPVFGFASAEPELIVNNRILATVNGKVISVIDVMKKMDVFLSRNYPEYTDSVVAREQFFSQNWRRTLEQMIDNELILADAEKMEMKVSDAEIRETIHERFGPNVMSTFDKLGLSYDEAWSMVYVEMAVQRMSWYRVHSKGLQKIGPQDIKYAFDEHLVTNPPKQQWKYQVLSIRAATEQLGNIYAQKAHSLIRNDPIPFEVLAEKLKEDLDPSTSTSITVSDEYEVEDKNLSSEHKAVLCKLDNGAYSEPIAQISRVNKSIVHRIFYLKDHTQEAPPSFDSMVDTLQDELVQKEIDQYFPAYLAKLRKTFNFDQAQLDSIPRDFQPFSLQ